MKAGHIASLILLYVLLMSMAANASAAPYIKSVTFSKDPLVLNQLFDVRVRVGSVTSSMNVQIYFDDDQFVFHEISVGSGVDDQTINIPRTDWDEDQQLLNLKCGTHTLTAKLVKDGQVYDTLIKDFNVGNVPIIKFDPERPNPGSSVKVYLLDSTGDPLTQMKVSITYQGEDKRSETYNTDTAGYFIFTPSSQQAGRYKLVVETKKEYCGEMYFYVKRNPLIDGPNPKNPTVGDMITVAVPSGDMGVKVYDSSGDFYLAARTLITGAVNFTISDPGDYTLVIGEGSARYWSVNRTLTVAPRPLFNAEIEPASPRVKGQVIVTVKAGDTPLANARVKVVTPAGSTREYSTLANGKAIILGDFISTMGEYTVIIESPKYQPLTKTFRAKNGFQMEFDPEVPLLNTQVTLFVKDQDGIFVPDAQVNVEEAQLVGATDAEGKYAFTLTEKNPNVDPGEYTIDVSKDMFWPLSQKIKTQDTLELLVPAEAEVGNDVNVNVYNSRGGLVGDGSVSVKITSPSSDENPTLLNKANFTFKPVMVGDYALEAGKNQYISTSGLIKITPHPLSVDARIDGGDLIIKVESRNESVPDMAVSVALSDGRTIKTLTTDINGTAKIAIDDEGNISITANDRDRDILYETASTTKYIKKSYRILILIVVVVCIVAGTLVVTYLLWHVRTLHHRRDRERFSPHKGGSGLRRF